MRVSSVKLLCLFALGVIVAGAGSSLAVKPTPPPDPVLIEVVPVNQEWGGFSYSALTAKWWQWALCQHYQLMPANDPTGALAAVGQEGAIWFLAGSMSGDPVKRTVTIPAGKAIFFPIINTSYIGFPWDRNDTPQYAWEENVYPYMEGIDLKSLYCVIDGVSVPKLTSYRADSGGAPDHWSFKLKLPADSFYGTFFSANIPEYHGQTLPDVTDGYWILLKPLPVGTHTIAFGGKGPDGEQKITYDITVAE